MYPPGHPAYAAQLFAQQKGGKGAHPHAPQQPTSRASASLELSSLLPGAGEPAHHFGGLGLGGHGNRRDVDNRRVSRQSSVRSATSLSEHLDPALSSDKLREQLDYDDL